MNPPFKVVIAYENFEHGIRAREMVERLIRQLPSPFKFQSDVWRFQWFGHPFIRDRAAEQARKADMIVLSARSSADLPVDVMTWLDAWLPQKKERGGALVALIEQEEVQDRPPSPLRTQLVEMAAQGGVDFFWHTPSPEGAGRGRRSNDPTQPSRFSPASGEVPADRLSGRGWGINE